MEVVGSICDKGLIVARIIGVRVYIGKADSLLYC